MGACLLFVFFLKTHHGVFMGLFKFCNFCLVLLNIGLKRKKVNQVFTQPTVQSQGKY